MSTTKYQLLYRYMNEGTNTPITNKMDYKYIETREFYTDPDHRIFSVDEFDKAVAIDEQQEMISYGNSGDNPKANMIFAYDGTKKIKHQKWVEEKIGYVVRDYTAIPRSKIGNRGDFTKEFTTIGDATVEDGGQVVCGQAVFDKYFTATITVLTDNTKADGGTTSNPFYTVSKITELIREATLFELNTTSYEAHMAASRDAGVGTGFFDGPIAVGQNNMISQSIHISYYAGQYSYGMRFCANSSEGLYSKATILKTQILSTMIPGHYEDVNDYPYLIKDTYKRIQLSPWFVNCTTCSLESAITKAKILVDMIGLDNVKLIKIVPFGQFVKIQ